MELLRMLKGLRLRGPVRTSHIATHRVVFPIIAQGRHAKGLISELYTLPTQPRTNAVEARILG